MALCKDSERIVPNWRIVPTCGTCSSAIDDVEAIYAEVQRHGAPID
jgi:hypothetical protein